MVNDEEWQALIEKLKTSIPDRPTHYEMLLLRLGSFPHFTEENSIPPLMELAFFMETDEEKETLLQLSKMLAEGTRHRRNQERSVNEGLTQVIGGYLEKEKIYRQAFDEMMKPDKEMMNSMNKLLEQFKKMEELKSDQKKEEKKQVH